MRLLLVSLLALGCTSAPEDADFPDGPHHGIGDEEDNGAAKPVPYKGGPVLHAPVEAHVYWGGYWTAGDGAREVKILDRFAERVGDSAWYGMAGWYPDNDGPPGAPFATSTVLSDDEPGDRVTDRGLRSFITDRLNAGDLDWDAEAVYFIFTPPGTVVSTPWGASCDEICGYHYHYSATIHGHKEDVKYAGIPYGECPDDCGARGLSANGPALDQMTVTLSHELMEAVTDPDINAWTGPRGDPEVADLCDDGFVVNLGGTKFALQEIWSNVDLACMRSVPQLAK